MLKSPSQGFFNACQQQLEKVSGDTLIIMVSMPLLPLKGMAEIIDWRLNSLLSRLIVEEKYEGAQGESLLLPCKDKLPVERVVILGLGRTTKTDIVKILKGLKSKECSIVFPKNFKKDLRTFFFDDVQSNSFNWNKIEEKSLGDENLITLNKIHYS
ncbi:MAG: M17 family peptidase N-terminal domain-containing protein [bacterium]